MGNGSNQSSNPLQTGLRPSCHLWETREIIRMLSGRTNSRQFCFCVTAAARPLCFSVNHHSCYNGTKGRTKEAEWRQSHWSAKGGTMVVQGRQKHHANWHAMFTTVRNSLRGEQWLPLCIHFATMAMRMPSSCLPWVTCERPTSSATFVQLFLTCQKLHGDHGVHGQVWKSCAPPLSDQFNHSASFKSLTVTSPVLRSHKGGGRRSYSLCKGGITKRHT